MDKLDPVPHPSEPEFGDDDLTHRLARYRRRLEAEGRPRSVRVIDKAIEDASKSKPRR